MPEQGATYTFEDLSGNHAASSDDPNPYNALIKSCNNDPVREYRLAMKQYLRLELLLLL
jgi:hypothetical protein